MSEHEGITIKPSKKSSLNVAFSPDVMKSKSNIGSKAKLKASLSKIESTSVLTSTEAKVESALKIKGSTSTVEMPKIKRSVSRTGYTPKINISASKAESTLKIKASASKADSSTPTLKASVSKTESTTPTLKTSASKTESTPKLKASASKTESTPKLKASASKTESTPKIKSSTSKSDSTPVDGLGNSASKVGSKLKMHKSTSKISSSLKINKSKSKIGSALSVKKSTSKVRSKSSINKSKSKIGPTLEENENETEIASIQEIHETTIDFDVEPEINENEIAIGSTQELHTSTTETEEINEGTADFDDKPETDKSTNEIDINLEENEITHRTDSEMDINASRENPDFASEMNENIVRGDSSSVSKQESLDFGSQANVRKSVDLEQSSEVVTTKRGHRRMSQVVLPHLNTAAYHPKLAERTTKRVLAPYIRTAKRYVPSSKQSQDKSATPRGFPLTPAVKGLRRKPDALTRNLAAYLNDTIDLTTLLLETADVLQLVTKSDGVTLYLINFEAGEIYNQPKNVLTARPRGKWKISDRATVAAFVAFHREYLVVEDLPNETRFPEGLGWVDPNIRAVLCVPVVTPDDELIALIELYKEQIRYENDVPFERVDLQIVVTVTGWMGAAIHQNQQRQALQLSQDLNDTLLELTRKYFSDLLNIDKIITSIVQHAKVMIGAERGAFFIINREKGQLVADLYDESIDNVRGDQLLLKKKTKIEFDKHRGIAASAAMTGEAVNVRNAYDDPRFDPEVDMLTGVVTRSVLCSPFKGSEGVIGMIQLVNKIDGPYFTVNDEKTLSSYTVYCTLSLNYYQTQKSSKHARMVDAVESEMLTMHFKPCIHDRNRMFQAPLREDLPPGFNKFSWYLTGYEDQMAQLVFFMITDMAPNIFDEKTLCLFILTVKKGYRKNPYHNYDHAFNVAHCMYNILKRNQDVFTALENKALVIAALCHDIDHRGFTNNFMQQINAELIQLYPESCMENHHFQTTMRILQSTKLFNHVSSNEYKDIVDEIHDAIIATDLALYFRCRPRLISLMVNDEFDWTVNNHRVLVKSIIMTTCDLSGQAKPFPVAKRITESLYREFYHQGDLEKEMGLIPLSMMDREKQHTIPTDQKRFIDIVVLPCVELLAKVLPNTVELYNLSRDLRNHWDEIIELRIKAERAAKSGLLHQNT